MSDFLLQRLWPGRLLRALLAAFLCGGLAHAQGVPHAASPAQGARQAAPAVSGSRGDLERAYAAQQRLVAGWGGGDAVAGYKSAFGTPALQQRFGLDRPAMAVLPASGLSRVEGAAPVFLSLGDYRRPMLETEVALRIGAPLREAPETPTGLLAFIDAVMPAIEIPELALDGVEAPRGVEYIATNIGTRRYLLGAPQPVALLGRTPPRLVLRREGEILSEGRADATLASAFRLVGQVLARGYELQPGQVLLTGAVGALVPAEPGDYEADYGELGRIRFLLRDTD